MAITDQLRPRPAIHLIEYDHALAEQDFCFEARPYLWLSP